MDNNRIEFPKNNDVMFNKGIEAFENNELEKAENIFSDLYLKTSSKQHTLLYMYVLYELENYEFALDVIAEHEKWFLSGDIFNLKYIEILIKSAHFLKAEVLLNRLEINESNKNEIMKLTKELETSRQAYKMAQKEQREQSIKDIYGLASKDPMTQRIIVQNSNGFKNPQKTLAYKQALMNPYIDELAKTIILSIMLDEGNKESFDILWHGEKNNVDLSLLVKLDDHQTVNSLMNLAEEKLANNPTFLKAIQEEMSIHLAILYPFIDEVITDKRIWLEMYIEHYVNGEQLDTDDQMQQWFNKLNNQMF